jgi:hypothetical protein
MYEDVNISPEDKKKTAQYLWKELGNIPVDDDCMIELPFLHFPVGTWNEIIWLWFESTFDVSIVEDLHR